MANKSDPWVLSEPVIVLTENTRIDWYGCGYGESRLFQLGMGMYISPP